MSSNIKSIDLRGIPCPLNFVRCSLALESLRAQDNLQVDLDRGEPEEMVLSGLRNQGHVVKIVYQDDSYIRLLVSIGA